VLASDDISWITPLPDATMKIGRSHKFTIEPVERTFLAAPHSTYLKVLGGDGEEPALVKKPLTSEIPYRLVIFIARVVVIH